MTAFTPSPDRILIEPDKDEKVTESGFILKIDEKDKPLVGRIITIGSKSRFEKEVEGRKVSFSRYGADEIRVGTSNYFVVSDAAILGFYAE